MINFIYRVVALVSIFMNIYKGSAHAVAKDSLYFYSELDAMNEDSVLFREFESPILFYNGDETVELDISSDLIIPQKNLFYYLLQNNSINFQSRGVNKRENTVYINGMQWENYETKSFDWSTISNLHKVFVYEDFKYGLETNDFGSVNLGTSISLNNYSSLKDKASGVLYAISNANFQHNLSAYHHSGLLKSNWSISLSLSKKWAKETYIEGNAYDAFGFYFGISKKIGKKHSLHFSSFGSPFKRTNNSAITEELITVLNNPFYNPNWGWQNGKKRNANEKSSFMPIAFLNYDYNINPNTNLYLGFSYQQGIEGSTQLEWYNSQDPRPDYYKNLPSYYMHPDENKNEEIASALLELWQNDTTIRQLNWHRFYEVNQSNIDSEWMENQKRSLYILGEQKSEVNNFKGLMYIDKQLNKNLHAKLGIQGAYQKQENFKEIKDLLGGDYYVNLNQFAEHIYIEDFNLKMNNLLDENPIKGVNEKYDYHYFFYYKDLKIWSKWQYDKDKWRIKLISDLKYLAYQRDGKFKNGLYPEESYGKSKVLEFLTYSLYLNTQFKIKNTHFISANGYFRTQAPVFTNTFIAPKLRNTIINNADLEKSYGFDFTYMYYSPKLLLSMQYFTYEQRRQLSILRFYHEAHRGFVNYVMSGINSRNLGIEYAMQVQILSSLKLHILGVWQQAFYTSNVPIQIYRDNDTASTIEQETVYWKNYYKGVGPQSFYNIGFTYFTTKYGFVQINGNFSHRNYIEKNPNSLTSRAIELVDFESDQFKNILEQRELPYSYYINIQFGKTFMVKKIWKQLSENLKFKIYASIYNVLNTKNIMQAHAQLRFDFTTKNASKFPEKLYYDYGRTFTLGISIIW